MAGAYKVEVERAGCATCGHGTAWIIIDPDGIGGSSTYIDEEGKEAAEDICEDLNRAYEKGKADGVLQQPRN